jgi:hypothetical protein
MAIIRSISARGIAKKWAAEARTGGDPRQVEREIQEFKDQSPARFADSAAAARKQELGAENRKREEMRNYAQTGGEARHLYGSGMGNVAEKVADMANPAVWAGIDPGLRARTKDQVIGRQIREQIPDAATRFPTLGAEGSVGEDDLKAILNSLSPEEYKKVTGAMARYADPAAAAAGAAAEAAASPAGSAFGGTKRTGAAPAVVPRSAHIGGPQASAAGSQAEAVAEILKPVAAAMMAAAQAHMAAAREQMNPFSTLPDLGGSIGPMRA